MNLLAVDPGQRGCGVAIFSKDPLLAAAQGVNSYLLAAAYVRNPVTKGDGLDSWTAMARAINAWFSGARGVEFYAPFELIIECPRVYPGPQQKGDQNDLIALAGVVGAVALACSGSEDARRRVYPRDWKGTIDPDAMTERIRSRLTAAELKRIEPCPKSLEHNLLDAVGIGLHALGRLEPRRVFPR